jgi:hypothetical protein
MTEYREFNGVMFIGDPHVSSRRPGDRKDKNFGETVVGKIKFCIDHCNEHGLLPVFLGDMYDTSYEPSESLKTKLARVLKSSKEVPLSNVGNHDIQHAVLTDDDSLAYLAATGVIRLNAYAGALETIKVGGKLWGIGATPYGQEITGDARPFFPEADMIIWLTHHDLAFENPYPGSMPLPEVKGAKLVVNGHMHLRKKTKKVGECIVFNPGNITRQFPDAIEHDPAVYILTKEGKLDKLEIPHERAIFNLKNFVRAISPGEAKSAAQQELETAEENSEFVRMLDAESVLEAEKSDDGTIVLREIRMKFERDETPKDVRNYIEEMHRRAVAAAA